MDLNQLRYFYQVAQSGSFSRASEILFVQQPTVSKMVKQLEDSLGEILFERKKSGVLLTTTGQKVFDSAEKIFNEVGLIKKSIDTKNSFVEEIKIGSIEPVSSFLMAEVVERLRRENPLVKLRVLTGTADYLVEQLNQGLVDLVLAYHLPKMNPGQRIYQQINHDFVLVRATQMTLSKDMRFDFIGSRELENKKNKSFPTFELLKDRYPQCQRDLSTNSIFLQKQLVLRGLAVGIFPEYCVRQEISSGLLKVLKLGQKSSFNLKFLVREKSLDHNKADLVIEALKGSIS